MAVEIAVVNVRVRKEQGSGITEVFVTSNTHPINFSRHLKGDVDIESGSFKMMLERIELAKIERPDNLPAGAVIEGKEKPVKEEE